MKHVIVTRCKFDDEDKFEKYFQVIKECYVKSINNQTNKNFSIALICNEKHFQKIRDLVDNDIEIVRFEDQKKRLQKLHYKFLQYNSDKTRL